MELECRVVWTAPDGQQRAAHATTLSVLPSGAILMENEALVTANTAASALPRVGLTFRVPPALSSCRWYGRGPFENYPDRCRGAPIARHQATADELFTPYIYPSENGHRGDVRWLEVQSKDGDLPIDGLRVCGATPFGFSLQQHSVSALTAATHQNALFTADADAAHLTIDHRMMGVGGDTGWSQSVRPEYRVPAGTHRWSLLVQPAALPPPDALPEDLTLRIHASDPAFTPLSSWQRARGLFRSLVSLLALVGVFGAMLASLGNIQQVALRRV